MTLNFDQILRVLDGGGTLALSVIVIFSVSRLDRRLDMMHSQIVDLLSDALGRPRPEPLRRGSASARTAATDTPEPPARGPFTVHSNRTEPRA